jgi:hypothetical protein
MNGEYIYVVNEEIRKPPEAPQAFWRLHILAPFGFMPPITHSKRSGVRL